MKRTAWIMGMPAIITVSEAEVEHDDIEAVFDQWRAIDQRFSPFLETSELTKFNRRQIPAKQLSAEFREIQQLCAETKRETNGYFDAYYAGQFEPSGLVKGWAIERGTRLLQERGYRNFYVEIGGDIQTRGVNEHGQKWRVGIRQPLQPNKLAAIVELDNQAIATSGDYLQPGHLRAPLKNTDQPASLSVVAPSIYDADRFATAAYLMGQHGATFIATQKDCSALVIEPNGELHATPTFPLTEIIALTHAELH